MVPNNFSFISELRLLAKEPMTVTINTPTKTTILALKPTGKLEPVLTAEARQIALGALGLCCGVAAAYVGYKSMGGFEVTHLDLNPSKLPSQPHKLPPNPLWPLNKSMGLNMCPRELYFAKRGKPLLPLLPMNNSNVCPVELNFKNKIDFTKQQQTFSKHEPESEPKTEVPEQEAFWGGSVDTFEENVSLTDESALTTYKFEPDDSNKVEGEKHAQDKFEFDELINKSDDHKEPVTIGENAEDDGSDLGLVGKGLVATAVAICSYGVPKLMKEVLSSQIPYPTWY